MEIINIEEELEKIRTSSEAEFNKRIESLRQSREKNGLNVSEEELAKLRKKHEIALNNELYRRKKFLEEQIELNNLKSVEYRKEKFGGDFFIKLYEKTDEARYLYDTKGERHISPFGSWYYADVLEHLVKALNIYWNEKCHELGPGYGLQSHDVMGFGINGYLIQQHGRILLVGKHFSLIDDFQFRTANSVEDGYACEVVDRVSRIVPIDFNDFINDRKPAIDRETVESIVNPKPKEVPVFYGLDGKKFNTPEEAIEYNNSLSNGFRRH